MPANGKRRVNDRPVSQDRYHHGDLRWALIAEARAMIEREGASQISLRSVAAAVGVSPNAPYHHFADKAGLLAAVANVGFQEFHKTVSARGAGEKDPITRLRKLAIGYVEFAIGSPELFRLMFGSSLNHNEHPELAKGGAESAALLTHTVQACLSGASPTSIRDASAAAWSLVHGLAVLCNDGRIKFNSKRDLERRVIAVTAHFSVSSEGAKIR